MTNKQQLRAKKILAANKKADAVHFTSDESAFTNEGNAKAHAKRLADKTIVTVTAEQAKAAVEDAVGAEDTGGKVVKMGGETKPLDKMNKTELLAEVAKREGLQVAGNATNKAILEAIQAFDTPAEGTKPAEQGQEGTTQEQGAQGS